MEIPSTHGWVYCCPCLTYFYSMQTKKWFGLAVTIKFHACILLVQWLTAANTKLDISFYIHALSSTTCSSYGPSSTTCRSAFLYNHACMSSIIQSSGVIYSLVKVSHTPYGLWASYCCQGTMKKIEDKVSFYGSTHLYAWNYTCLVNNHTKHP